MSKTVIQSWKLLSPSQRVLLALLASAAVASSALDLFALALVGVTAGLALAPETYSSEFIPLEALGPEPIFPLLGATAIFFTAKSLVSVYLTKKTALFLAQLESEFSLTIAKEIFDGDLLNMRKNSRADIEWALLRSTNVSFSAVLLQAIILISSLSQAIAVFVFLLVFDVFSALFILLYFSLVLTIFHFYSTRVVGRIGAQFSGGSVEVAEAISNLVAAFKEISVLSKIDLFLGAFASARNKVAKAEATNQYLQSVPRLILEVALIVGALGYLSLQFLAGAGSSSLPIFAIFLVGSLRMTSALLPVQRSFMGLKFSSAAAASSQNLLKPYSERTAATSLPIEAPSPPKHEPAPDSSVGGLNVEIRNLSFEYRDATSHLRVLQEINMSIPQGSRVAIIGPSGAGKTTLVDLILGLHKPSRGEIVCGGSSPTSLRANSPGIIGYVPQNPGIISGSLLKNIALGVADELVDHDRLRRAVANASLTALISSLPDGLHTNVGAQANKLSGGQIQRLGLARALYTAPRLLVLDEATSALDAETEAGISDSLEALGTETTVIVVAHRLTTIQKMDWIFVLDGGTVTASGTFNELRATNLLFQKYVDILTFKTE